MYVHHRLTRCPHAQQRQDDARPEDLHHVGGLHVPQSFIDHILTEHMPTMQYPVAWHQYHMLMEVTQLRKDLTMPPRTMTEGIDPVEKRETPWYYKLNPHSQAQSYHQEVVEAMLLYKRPRHKKRAKLPPPADTQRKKVHAPVSKLPTHITKLKAIQIMSNLPQT